jgi:hypothetical protein
VSRIAPFLMVVRFSDSESILPFPSIGRWGPMITPNSPSNGNSSQHDFDSSDTDAAKAVTGSVVMQRPAKCARSLRTEKAKREGFDSRLCPSPIATASYRFNSLSVLELRFLTCCHPLSRVLSRFAAFGTVCQSLRPFPAPARELVNVMYSDLSFRLRDGKTLRVHAQVSTFSFDKILAA